MRNRIIAAAAIALIASGAALAQAPREPVKVFTASDVFRLESASSPQISPDGKLVAYVRVSGDVMVDRFRRSIWIVDETGANHWPVAQGKGNYASPVWSPDGKSIAYVASDDGVSELRTFDMASHRSATLARLPSGAQNLAWSPDGRTLAFQSFVKESGPRAAVLPPKPEGAQWAEPAKVYDTINYRSDGSGLVDTGYTQIFVLPIDGGTPRQLTFQDRDHDGRLGWRPDGKALLFSANVEEDWEYNPQNSDIYSLDVSSGAITRLTTRVGPDDGPVVSPNGKLIAYTGFDEKELSYQVTDLYVANADGSNPRALTAGFDRDISNPQWAGDGAIWFRYEEKGNTHLARIAPTGGKPTIVASDLVGAAVDRPYTGGAFSVNRNGRFAITQGGSATPAEIAISSGSGVKTLTSLNSDVFTGKQIGQAELLTTPSSFDRRPVEAWVVKPPNFDPAKRYPLLLEIHGGPHTAYGPTFSAEVQMFAAAGYVVVYANPRGSTSYGGEFGGLIHHNYPSQDYDDLMSVVDATIAKYSVDPNKLFVTGGSGGGVLTAWIVSSNNRFAAAMVQKPVINWTSHVLSADGGVFYARYWFGEKPWEPGAQERYWKRSPLSRVGSVKTPTAVLVGEEDNRTPHTEAEQYYQALQIQKVPTELILIPGASHDLAGRPTGLIAKTNNTLAWFARYGGPPVPDPVTGKASGGEPTASSPDVAR
jgi:dipeptidyl aminopeptidase/acylaminoacyl peptidase